MRLPTALRAAGLFPAAVLFACGVFAQDLSGSWRGECRSVVNFMTMQVVPVTLHIDAGGTVAGTVGDARIVDGRLRPRAWYEPRSFNHFEYRIDFKLEGPISQQDKIVRAGGRINFDVAPEGLHGWFVSSGWHVGSRDTMQITTRGLVLRRTQ